MLWQEGETLLCGLGSQRRTTNPPPPVVATPTAATWSLAVLASQ